MTLSFRLLGAALLFGAFPALGLANTVTVTQTGFGFSPQNPTIQVGDTVKWNWTSGTHTVTEGTDGLINGNELFTSPLTSSVQTFSFTFSAAFVNANPKPGGVYDYFCQLHFSFPMKGTITVTDPVATPFCYGDGSGTACPCANVGTAGNGCPNFASTAGAHLTTSGVPSIGFDTLVLSSSQAIPFGPGLYFQGSSQVAGGSVFGNGLLCLSGSTPRLEIQFANGAGAASSTVAIHAFGSTAAGDVRHYQLWYRDDPSFCPNAGFNLSNAVTLTWIP